MTFVLTVVHLIARDAAPVPSAGGGSRKEIPMGCIAHRIWSVCSSMLVTTWAIGTSYVAGALPA